MDSAIQLLNNWGLTMQVTFHREWALYILQSRSFILKAHTLSEKFQVEKKDVI